MSKSSINRHEMNVKNLIYTDSGIAHRMASISTLNFVTGFWVGLAVAAPIGPMGLLCIQRTLAYGIVAGLGTGLAAATVQVSYGTMALLGPGPAVLGFVGESAPLLSGASAVVLLWFAARTVRSANAVPAGPTARGPGLLGSFRDALALGFSNPMGIALFLAASPALGWVDGRLAVLAAIAGVFAGAIGWYASLSSAVYVSRSYISARNLVLTRRLSAFILLIFAAYMLSKAIFIRT